MTAFIDPATLLDIADKLGLIDSIKTKLFRNPDSAAEKLATVLDEVSKIYSSLESELVKFLSLNFDPTADLVAERQVLLTLESGQLMVRMGEAGATATRSGTSTRTTSTAGFTGCCRPRKRQTCSDCSKR